MRALPSSPASRRLRRLVGVGTCAVVVALTGGCGFLDALADPAPSSGSATASSGATASATPAAATPDSAAAADLAGSADDRPASLAVSVWTAPEQGVPPVATVAGPLAWAECQLDPAATEYVTLGIRFTDPSPVTKQRGDSSNLRLDVTTVGGSHVGVVVDTVNATSYCHGTALPAQSDLQSQNLTDEHQTMTVYVVARTTPADPDPLSAVTVQLRNLRHHPGRHRRPGLDLGRP